MITTNFYVISDGILSGTNTSRDISIVMNNCKKYVNYLEAHIRNFNFEKIIAELFVLQIVAHSDIRATVFRLLSNLMKVIAKKKFQTIWEQF